MKVFTVQPETLAYLGNQWGMSEDNLSPLFNVKLGKGNDKEINRFKKEGILDSNNLPTSKYESCFSALKDAKFRTAISMTGNGADFEFQAFEDDKGNKASILATFEGLEIQSTPDLEMFQTAISQYTGQSLIKSSDLKLSYDLNVMVVLAAMIDVSRKYLMKTFFENENQTIICSESDIKEALEESSDNGQYLTMYVKAMSGTANIDVNETMVQLEKLTHVNAISGGWTLSDEIIQMIMGWYSIENFVQISMTRKNMNNSLDQLNAWILQFGIHDLVVLERQKNIITLRTISGGELFGLMEQTIKTKDILSQIPEPTMEESYDEKRFCSNCGKPITKGARFCGECGEPVQ